MTARAILVGLIAGGLGGILLVEFGMALLLFGALPIAIGCAVRPGPVGAAGTLIGWGALWVALFANAAHMCEAQRNCGESPPSVVPWIAVGVGLVVVGFALLVAAYHRGHGRPPEPS